MSLDSRLAARVRLCGATARGGASGYLERLVREDETREAVAAMGRWYLAKPAAESDAFLDAVDTELADRTPAEQRAALRQLRLGR